jgi:hypothetical protein
MKMNSQEKPRKLNDIIDIALTSTLVVMGLSVSIAILSTVFRKN